MKWLYIAAGLTALIAIAGWLFGRAPLWSKIIVLCFIVAVCVVQILAIRRQEREKEISRYAGVLEGKPITVLSPKQAVYPKLQLGNSKAILVWQGPEGQALFKIFEDSDLTIWVENDALKISTKIRNKNGEIVAELVGNEWKTKPERIWDRNYSDNALEIMDMTGDVILQVVLKEDVVQFAAKMYSSSGQGVGLGSTEDPELGVVGVIELTGAEHRELELRIEPIFEYPSDLHLGEFRETK